jgi:hypothetical protein
MGNSPGITPKGIAEKSRRLREGLEARRDLLSRALQEGWDSDDLDRAGIPTKASQTNLVCWHDPDRGIFRLALNTAKKHSDLFKEIRDLLDLVITQARSTRSKSSTQVADRSETIASLKRTVRAHKETISNLSGSLVDLRALTLMLLREFDDDSRLTPFQKERLQSIRAQLKRRTPKT